MLENGRKIPEETERLRCSPRSTVETVGGVNGERGGLAGGEGGGGGSFRATARQPVWPLTPCLESASGVSVDAAGLQQKIQRKVRNPFVNIAISAKECKKKKKIIHQILAKLQYCLETSVCFAFFFFRSSRTKRFTSPSPDRWKCNSRLSSLSTFFVFVLFLTWLFVSRPRNLTARSKNAIKTCSSCNQSRIAASWKTKRSPAGQSQVCVLLFFLFFAAALSQRWRDQKKTDALGPF